MFERMEIAEEIYKGGAPSKNNQRAESKYAISVRKKKGGASASTSNLKQSCTRKRKRNDAGHLIDVTTGAKKTCLLHGPGHSLEECRVLKEYTEKRSAQNTYKDKQAYPGGNKLAKTIKLEDATQEVNTMKSHDEPIQKNRKGKSRRKNLRVIMPIHTHQRMNAFMVLTA